MWTETPNQYKALNDKSYDELMAYSVSLDEKVIVFPAQRTFIIDGKHSNDVSEFIEKQGLNFDISPIGDFHIYPNKMPDEDFMEIINNETTDPSSLRNIIKSLRHEKSQMTEQHEMEIAEITRKREAAEKDRDMYMRWYSESNTRANRIKGQIKAITLLLNEIYPEK